MARRVLGERNDITLRMRLIYARALYRDDSATIDDLHEAVATLEDMEPIVRRVFGTSHPTVKTIEGRLLKARAVLRAREETPSPAA
jgi:hypothetical protein